MGIKNLITLLKTYKEIKLNSLTGKIIAIDASILLYQYFIMIRIQEKSGLYKNLSNENGIDTSHIQGFFYKTLSFLEQGIRPVYVFDGKPPDLKWKTLKKRSLLKKENKEKSEELFANLHDSDPDLDNDNKTQTETETQNQTETIDNINKLEKRSVSITKEHINQIKKLLTLMGIPYITAPSEGEKMCSYLCLKKIVHACASEDFDCLAYGAPVFIRHLGQNTSSTKSKKKTRETEEILLKNVYLDLELNRDEFLDLCILCGSDYNSNIKGIGPKNPALKLIKKYKTIEMVVENERMNVPDLLENLNEIRSLFKNFDKEEELNILAKDIKLKKPDIIGLQAISSYRFRI